MKTQQVHHQEVIDRMKEHLAPVLEGSQQGIYVYLDDTHKFCNARFAQMLGYMDADEWAEVVDFVHLVDVGSRQVLANTYSKAVQMMTSSVIDVTWLKKNGQKVPSTCIMVPFSCDGHIMAIHFITLHDA